MITLNLKDKKIIYELDKDARQPLNSLSKKLGMSQQVVHYRLARLKKLGVIKKFITIINTAELGFLSYRVYIQYQKVDPNKEHEIIRYFKNHPNVHWFASLLGRWDIEILIFARNFFHYNQLWEDIVRNYGRYFRHYTLSMATYNYHFKRRYLVNRIEALPSAFYGGEPRPANIDIIDKEILTQLADDCRLPLVNIAQKVNMTPNAVKDRINRLRQLSIIQTYRLWVDISKFNFELYKIILTTEYYDTKIEKKIIELCNNIPNILYFIKCHGQWDIEIELEVPDSLTLRKILFVLRNNLSEAIRDIETILITKEHKINYFPV